MTKTRFTWMIAAALLLCSAATSRAVSPGDTFNASNVSQIQDMISPGVKWCVEHGMPITVGEYKKIEMPKIASTR